MGLMFWVIAGGYALIILMVYSAHQDSWLTVRQMKTMGDEQGLPLIWHMGIWGEALFITPLLGFITWRYAAQ